MVLMDITFHDNEHLNKLYSSLFLFFVVSGIIGYLYFALSLLAVLYRIVIPGIPITKFRQGKGSPYAVVTGPTSGIGKLYAFALAKAQFNLILVSRSLSKLEELRTEILAKYPKTEIKLVDIDIGAKPLSDKYADVLDEVHNQDGGDIRVLVNNAGMSHSMPVTFEETAEEEMEGILAVNAAGVLRITKATLPYLLNDRKKKRLIVNVGSFAGFTPTPLLATYSGTKAFLSAWSYALKSELKSKNIVVQHLITTKLAKIRRPSLLVPTENAFVRSALHNIGRDGATYWSHALYEWVIAVPALLIGGREGSVVVGINKKMHEDIRKRALKKAAKQK